MGCPAPSSTQGLLLYCIVLCRIVPTKTVLSDCRCEQEQSPGPSVRGRGRGQSVECRVSVQCRVSSVGGRV